MATLFTMSSVAQENAEDNAKTYRVAINKTSFPYHFVNSENNADGIMVELWRLWAKKQQVNIEFVPLNWQETIAQVQSGDIDIHAGLAIMPARAEQLVLSKAFFQQNQHLFLHRSLAKIKEVEQLTPYAVGVVAGSGHEILLRQKHRHLTIKTFPNRHALYSAALASKVLVIAGVEKLSKHFEEYDALKQMYPAFARIPYNISDFGTAVAKGNSTLLAFIDQGMAKISAAERANIEKKWLGIDKSDNVLTVSYFNDQMPFSDTANTGNAQGFLIEFWKMWSTFSGVNIEFIVADPKERAPKKPYDVDIQLSNMLAENKNQPSAAGPVIYNVQYGLYLPNDMDEPKHVSEIKYKNIGVVSTHGFIDDLNTHLPHANIRYFNNYHSLFSAATNGELDIIAGQRDVIEHYLIEYKLQSRYSYFNQYSFHRDIRPNLTADNLALGQLILEGLNEIPTESLVALEKKWHLNNSSGYFKRQLKQLTLTAQESLWLKQHNHISFGITKNWAPIEFVDRYGEFKGINPDIIQLLAQRLNITIDYRVYDNFDTMYQGVLTGDVDVIGSVVANEERKEQVLFTESYWHMPWVILHPMELGKQLNLDNFKGKSLAIAKGYYLVSRIRNEYPTITLRLVDNSEQGLLAVQKGLVDGFIDNLSSGSELLKRESLVNLTMSVLEGVDVEANHLAVNKALPTLANILNKAVLTISDADSQQIYEKWFDISIETGLNKNVVLRVAAQIAVVIMIIIVVIMAWNRRLYREIKSRRELEKQMKHMATHDDLTGLANRILLKDRLSNAVKFHQRQKLKIAVLFIDLDGFKGINDTYGHDVGDELLVDVATRLKGCVRESDTVVRFGGDEFVILLTGLHNQDEAAYVADKVLNVIQQPLALSAVNATIGCSMGIAMYPGDGNSDNELLKVADSLMYKAKAAGKNHFVFTP
ncbi:MAG: transporter substrate-binding domain-containing protein [Cognaticolwellia sp.]